jgi:hypothetical protein
MSQSDLQQFVGRNYVKNQGFENVKTNWTASGGTFAVVASGTGLTTGQASGDWDSNAAAQTLSNDSFLVSAGDASSIGVGSCRVKAASGTATHLLEIYDVTNTTVLASRTLISSTTTAMRTSIMFTMPIVSTAVRIRITSVAANEPQIFIDDCYLGQLEDQNLLYRSEFASATANCTTGTCTLSRNSQGVVSVTRAGTGDYTINFTAGVFSAAPVCVCVAYTSGTSAMRFCTFTGTMTATAMQFTTVTTIADTMADTAFQIQCTGFR